MYTENTPSTLTAYAVIVIIIIRWATGKRRITVNWLPQPYFCMSDVYGYVHANIIVDTFKVRRSVICTYTIFHYTVNGASYVVYLYYVKSNILYI